MKEDTPPLSNSPDVNTMTPLEKLKRATFIKRVMLVLVLAPLLLWVGIQARSANQNTPLPPEASKQSERAYNHVSIHPDGEHWLIDECTDRINPPEQICYVFLYNYKKQSYQRFDLDPDYGYADARFSPSGKWIIAVRRKLAKNSSYDEELQSYLQSELVLFRMDGTDLRVLPVPRGRIKSPVMSPDESKIAYWLSDSVRPPGSKTTFMGFDIHEFDLVSGEDRLFVGPHEFFLVENLIYESSNVIIAEAYGPKIFAHDMGAYKKKYGSSEIYRFSRGEHSVPLPAYATIDAARSPTIANGAQVYVLGQPKPHGQSIVKASDGGISKRWQVPAFSGQGIVSITVSPDGSYIVFISPTTPVRSRAPKNDLGIFDLAEERWLPVAIPLPASASLLRLAN